MNKVETKARTTRPAFQTGVSASAPGSATGAGGVNLKKGFYTEGGGSNLNKGRLNGGSEVHHDKQTVPSLKTGSTSPSR